MYICKNCGNSFKSYNKNPVYCSFNCKTISQTSKINFNKAKKLYESGMNQIEVAKKLGTTQKVIFSLFKRNNYKSRMAIKRNQLGENNDSWKGDNATYAAFHKRMYALFGKPNKCEICGTDDELKNYHWASLTGKYNEPSDFKRMCHSCHAKYDNIIKNINNRRENAR